MTIDQRNLKKTQELPENSKMDEKNKVNGVATPPSKKEESSNFWRERNH